MNTRQEFGHEMGSYDLEGYGKIDYAKWLNPFAYSMIVTKARVDFFKQFINEGDFVIDIGANIGDTGVPMGLAAGPTGTVLAMEPNPLIFKILELNAGLNRDKLNIMPLPYAATDEDGEFYYNSSEATFNNGGISKERSNFHGKFELENKITGINLERYLKGKHPDLLAKLTCIKVDTEGYDKDILMSIKNIIAEYKPTVMFEVFKKLDRDSRSELYDIFGNSGYELFKFDDFDINAPTQKITRDQMSNWTHFEVYAKHNR